MGWRQSIRRCKRSTTKFADGQGYQVFKAIRFLIASAKPGQRKFAGGTFPQQNSSPTEPILPCESGASEKMVLLERAIRQTDDLNLILGPFRSKSQPGYLSKAI